MGEEQGGKSMAEYDPSKSKVSEETMEKWRNRDLTGNLGDDAVPGIGEATCEKLVNSGVYDTTFKVLGAFLGCMGPEGNLAGCTAFKELLEEWDTPAAWRDTVITACAEKILAGFS